jgi:quinoprotein relay system zinc metallohydrolase 2
MDRCKTFACCLTARLSTAAVAGSAAPADAAAEIAAIAPGIYVRPGHDAVVFEDDGIANIGFIVGDRCVAVVDSGGSEAEARALAGAVRKVTTLPVCYLIDTHAHPDHLLGNKVFADAGATVVGHVKLARALGQRAATYLARASEQAGRTIRADTLVVPSLTVSDTMTLDLGNRPLQLTAQPSAHTDNDLTIYDVRTRTLWLGDILFVRHVPVLDGSLNGWIDVLDKLTRVAADRAVPGHGPASVPWPAAAADTQRYLTVLRDDVRRKIADGKGLREAQETAGYTEAGRWQLFAAYHARNVATAYAELEWE